MDYLCSKWREEESRRTDSMLYQIYVTDCLRSIAESSAAPYGGRRMDERWIDIYKRVKHPELIQKPETAEEVEARFNGLFLRKEGSNEPS